MQHAGRPFRCGGQVHLREGFREILRDGATYPDGQAIVGVCARRRQMSAVQLLSVQLLLNDLTKKSQTAKYDTPPTTSSDSNQGIPLACSTWASSRRRTLKTNKPAPKMARIATFVAIGFRRSQARGIAPANTSTKVHDVTKAKSSPCTRIVSFATRTADSPR